MNFFYLDVDGVLTDGTFIYDSNGKSHKIFGADDSDALQILRKFVSIEFISADHRGFGISQARVERDMGFKLNLVSGETRLEWLTMRHDLSEVIYMGDGFLDAPILKQVAIGISPNNANSRAKHAADYVTESMGGRGAVAEACFFLANELGLTIPEFDVL